MQKLRSCPHNVEDLPYKTLLRPKLEYAASVWDLYTRVNIQKLVAVQRRAASFVCNNHGRQNSVTAMMNSLGWPSLEQRSMTQYVPQNIPPHCGRESWSVDDQKQQIPSKDFKGLFYVFIHPVDHSAVESNICMFSAKAYRKLHK